VYIAQSSYFLRAVDSAFAARAQVRRSSRLLDKGVRDHVRQSIAVACAPSRSAHKQFHSTRMQEIRSAYWISL
jgi:hypothetical protein